MILPFLLALLAFLVLLPILLPLLQGSRPVASRASFDQAVYRDQLRELDRDIARGLVTPAEADASRLEIQRRLLASDRLPSLQVRVSRSPILAAAIFLIIALGSVATYLSLGAPGVPDESFASRSTGGADMAGPDAMRQATKQLAEKLKQNPLDAQSWLLYARTLAILTEWDKAEDAYRHAIDLGQTSPDVLADHAEMLVMQAHGTVTPATEAIFRQILQTDPSNVPARYYLATAAGQAGEPRKAIDALQALLADMPANSPFRDQIGERIAEAAREAGIPVPALAAGMPPAVDTALPGPDDKAVADAAAIPNEQREAMIRGMVSQLAAKQQANPSNLEGWLRLGRAYAVLHEPEQAADAYNKAAVLKPDDVSIPLQEARALLGDHKPADRLPPRVVALLKRVEARDPNEPMVLWYLGIDAVQDARPNDALRYWKALAAQLPAGSEDQRMIQQAIDTLSK